MTSNLGDLEELILLAVKGEDGRGYSVSICDLLNQAGRKVSITAVQTTLTRLEEKGLVRSNLGDPTPERGGRRKRFFQIEGAGASALQDAESQRATLRELIPGLI